MGYMPELNVLCPIGDYSAQSDQPLMKHVVVEIKPSNAVAARESDDISVVPMSSPQKSPAGRSDELIAG
jgi:hypothetical protein